MRSRVSSNAPQSGRRICCRVAQMTDIFRFTTIHREIKMSLSFKCLSCGLSTFSVDSEAILYGGVPVVTFVCDMCKEPNAVRARDGGGLVVFIDTPITSQSSAKKS